MSTVNTKPYLKHISPPSLTFLYVVLTVIWASPGGTASSSFVVTNGGIKAPCFWGSQDRRTLGSADSQAAPSCPCLHNLCWADRPPRGCSHALRPCWVRCPAASCTQKFLHAYFVPTHKPGAKMSVSIFFFKPICLEAITKLLLHIQNPRTPDPGEKEV